MQCNGPSTILEFSVCCQNELYSRCHCIFCLFWLACHKEHEKKGGGRVEMFWGVWRSNRTTVTKYFVLSKTNEHNKKSHDEGNIWSQILHGTKQKKMYEEYFVYFNIFLLFLLDWLLATDCQMPTFRYKSILNALREHI